jgi:16S rRNA (guanine527-N7)-methyltransferase
VTHGIPEEDGAFFERLFGLVVEANRTMNLTRITEKGEFLRKHVLDSVLPFDVVPELADLKERALSAADLGSGAGFPGLVLARLRPRWRVALLERTLKKARFLEEAVRALGLPNAAVLARDAREVEERFDLVTARAAGSVAVVTRAAARLLVPGGLLVHYKGGEPLEDELREGKRVAAGLGLEQEEPRVYALPPDAMRSVVISRATRRTRGEAGRPTRATGGNRGGRAP